MVRNGELDKDSGYHYKYDGVDMVEYHMDIHIQFQENCNHLLYGENLLECKPPNAKLVNNQDKVLFKQLQFGGSSWSLLDGSKKLYPKDEGQGLMLSAFCSHELRFDFQLLPEPMNKINEKRKGQKYSNETAEQ